MHFECGSSNDIKDYNDKDEYVVMASVRMKKDKKEGHKKGKGKN